MKRLSFLLACLVLPLAVQPPAAAQERESPPEFVPRWRLEEIASQTTDRTPIGDRAPRRAQAGASLTWAPLGPEPIEFEYWSQGPVSGRVSSIVVDPRYGDVAYVAAAQGGVWKTTDGGANWVPLTDQLSSLSSGALALKAGNPDVVYYATGEQHSCGDCWYGDGLFRSTDAGTTWSKIATRAQVGNYVNRIATHPAHPETLYVASSLGFVRSLDGGATWTRTLSDDWCYDLAQDPAQPDVVYTAMAGFGVYKSTDAGATWTRLGGGLPALGGDFDRIQIAIAPSNGSILYASYANGAGHVFGTYRTQDAGVTWSPLTVGYDYLGGQGWYDHCMIVDPASADICYIGGVYSYSPGMAGIVRTLDRGAHWSDVTIAGDGSRVHPDQHAFAFGPDGRLWVGNDGGVYTTGQGSVHWLSRNAGGLELTQFYSVAVHPSDPDRILGGTQDNGSNLFEGSAVWQNVISGDGGACLFLWNDPATWFTTYVYLDPVYRWHDGGYDGDGTGPWGGRDRVSFAQGPLVQDPNTPDALLAGTYRVWRSTNRGAHWDSLSGDLTGGSGVVYSIAVAPGGPNVIYAGTSTGRLAYTRDATNWVRRDAPLPRKAIYDICVSPTDSLTAFVSVDTTGGGRVWKTSDAGLSWTNVAGDLPAGLHARCLAVDFRTSPPGLYLGTDYGVYSSLDGGPSWAKEDGGGLPSLTIYDLAFTPGNLALVAATHGRGMWRADLASLAAAPRAPRAGRLELAAVNPSRGAVRIDYVLPGDAEISLEVYDLAGRRVRTIERCRRDAGVHHVVWDARAEDGEPVAAGLYFCRLVIPGAQRTCKLVHVE